MWSSQTPNLYPYIEYLWATLNWKLNCYSTPPKGFLELWECVFETFHFITSIECEKLHENMPRRMWAIIIAKGKWTDLWVCRDSRIQNWVSVELDFKIWMLPCIKCISLIVFIYYFYFPIPMWRNNQICTLLSDFMSTFIIHSMYWHCLFTKKHWNTDSVTWVTVHTHNSYAHIHAWVLWDLSYGRPSWPICGDCNGGSDGSLSGETQETREVEGERQILAFGFAADSLTRLLWALLNYLETLLCRHMCTCVSVFCIKQLMGGRLWRNLRSLSVCEALWEAFQHKVEKQKPARERERGSASMSYVASLGSAPIALGEF